MTNVANLGDPYTPSEARVNRIFERLSSRIGAIIMTAADEAVTKSLDQLDKAKVEVDGVIAELREQGVSPATIARLEAVSQAFDDIVPDPVDDGGDEEPETPEEPEVPAEPEA